MTKGADGQPIAPRLMSIEGAAAYLGLEKRAVYRLVETRQIPYVRIGAKVYFTRGDIEEWLARCRVQPLGTTSADPAGEIKTPLHSQG